MDLAKECAAFYAAVARGDPGMLSERVVCEVDGNQVDARRQVARLHGQEAIVEDVHVRRNLCFVQWGAAPVGRRAADAGLDILAFDQDGKVVQWSRHAATAE